MEKLEKLEKKVKKIASEIQVIKRHNMIHGMALMREKCEQGSASGVFIPTSALTAEMAVMSVDDFGYGKITVEQVEAITAIFREKFLCIKVPLPACNPEWTFEAYDWANRFCKEFPECYPVHYSELDNANYLYIRWGKGKIT